MSTTTYPGYEVVELGGLFVLRCLDCRQWCRPGQKVSHSRRCDLHGTKAPLFAYADAPGYEAEAKAAEVEPEPSMVSYAQLRRHARQGTLAAVLSDDEILQARLGGLISESEAMNRDF